VALTYIGSYSHEWCSESIWPAAPTALLRQQANCFAGMLVLQLFMVLLHPIIYAERRKAMRIHAQGLLHCLEIYGHTCC